MFSKRLSKSELRHQLQAEVDSFLQKGGEIQQVKMGESGLIDGKYNTMRQPFEKREIASRTPVSNVLAQIDARKSKKHQTTTNKKVVKTNQKTIIYDDFGEPLRHVWKDN